MSPDIIENQSQTTKKKSAFSCNERCFMTYDSGDIVESV